MSARGTLDQVNGSLHYAAGTLSNAGQIIGPNSAQLQQVDSTLQEVSVPRGRCACSRIISSVIPRTCFGARRRSQSDRPPNPPPVVTLAVLQIRVWRSEDKRGGVPKPWSTQYLPEAQLNLDLLLPPCSRVSRQRTRTCSKCLMCLAARAFALGLSSIAGATTYTFNALEDSSGVANTCSWRDAIERLWKHSVCTIVILHRL